MYSGEDLNVYASNIENCIVKVTLIVGSITINDSYAKGDFLLPMTTTEAALIASYHHGSVLISKAGGGTALLLSEGIIRSPGFAFKSTIDLANFSQWILLNNDKLSDVAKQTSNYC